MSASEQALLHLTNGDSAAESLRGSGIPGRVVALRDMLHDGPALPLSGAAWRERRADFLLGAFGVPRDTVLASYEAEDEALASVAARREAVLWFDHELLDQLQLARALHHLATSPGRSSGSASPAQPTESATRPGGAPGATGTAVSLVCIDRHPGIEPFIGLGQLQPAQLAALFPARVPLAPAQLMRGARLWDAYTSDDPVGLERLLAGGMELAYLAPALRRFLEEYPSSDRGLPRTEALALNALAAGVRTTHELFRAVQARERWLFMGDSSFGLRLRSIAAGPHPLVRVSAALQGDAGLPPGEVQLTDAGRAVLSGAADAIVLNGFDRWLGGVHLRAAPGEDVAWRWDGGAGQLVRR